METKTSREELADALFGAFVILATEFIWRHLRGFHGISSPAAAVIACTGTLWVGYLLWGPGRLTKRGYSVVVVAAGITIYVVSRSVRNMNR